MEWIKIGSKTEEVKKNWGKYTSRSFIICKSTPNVVVSSHHTTRRNNPENRDLKRERERETRLGSSMYLMPVVIREFHNERRLKFWILFQVCKGHSFPKDEYFVLNTVSCLTHICVTNRAVLFILCLAFSVPLFLLTFHLSFTKANYAGNWRLFLSACCCEMVFAFSHPLHWIFICLGSSFCFLVLKPG